MRINKNSKIYLLQIINKIKFNKLDFQNKLICFSLSMILIYFFNFFIKSEKYITVLTCGYFLAILLISA